MKLSVAVALALGSVPSTLVQAVPSDKLFRPYRIAYSDLMEKDVFETVQPAFIDALTSVGMVSVTNIPSFARPQALGLLHDCAMESDATLQHTFADGTVRHTMAAHTVPNGMQSIQHGTDSSAKTSPCEEFSKASDNLRQSVAAVTEAFTVRLNSVLNLEDASLPLLATSSAYPFKSLVDVVENGEHLEHFHSYEKVAASSDTTDNSETIDYHVDQGLFIAFTPALLIDVEQQNTEGYKPTVSDGFYVELQDGSQVMVKFDSGDDLVFMLGDGIQQLVNPRLAMKSRLRATPHALVMPQYQGVRSWYGRMVLAPGDAIHPTHGMTFDEIRQGLIDGRDQDMLNLGCSSHMSARMLDETECTGDSIYCWHRCMNTTEFGVSDEICAADGLDLRCINPRNQLYVDGHGDFYPGCINASSAINVTDYPPLDNAPRDEEECSLEDFESFAGESKYENSVVMGNATLSWSVVDGMLDGRLTFNGLFGWLAFGLADVDGGLNGMLGASIIMALPGGNYSAADGLDLSIGDNVNEYMISPEASAFRHWSDPVAAIARSASSKKYTVEANDCFTAISFLTDNINNIKFNLDGKDELLWAANDADYYVGYHGGYNRARFSIDWANKVVMGAGGEAIPVKKVDSAGRRSVALSSASAVVVVMLACFMF